MDACAALLTDNARVARSLGLTEYFGQGAEVSVAGAEGSVDVGEDEQLPNCFFTDQRPCFYPTYPTTEFLGKCVPVPPTNLSAAQVIGFPGNGTAYLLASDFMASPVGLVGDVVAELAQTWRVVVAFSCSAVPLGLLWLLLLRGFATCLLLTILVSLLGGMLFITLLAWDKAGVTSISALLFPTLAAQLAQMPVSTTGAYAIALVFSVLTCLMFLTMVVMGKRFLVAVRLIQEAARAVGQVPSILLVPLTNIPALLLLAVWVSGAGLLLASAGDFDPVLGAYSYALSPPAAQRCADRVLLQNPLVALAMVGGEQRQVTYEISTREAERLCVVYQDPARAIDGWRLRVSSKLARLPPTYNASVDAEALVSSIDYGNWAREAGVVSNYSFEGWLLGGYRYDLPFTVSDYYQYYWGYHLLLCLWTYTFTTTAAVMIIAGAVGHWYFRYSSMYMRICACIVLAVLAVLLPAQELAAHRALTESSGGLSS